MESLLTDTIFDSLRVTALLLAIPLGVTITVGLSCAILQGATQIQDPSLTLVPKLVAISATLIFGAPILVNFWNGYMEEIFRLIQTAH